MVHTTGHEKKPVVGKLFFLIKIFNFYQKNNFPPIDFFSCPVVCPSVFQFAHFTLSKS